jgi:hypothetical protein
MGSSTNLQAFLQQYVQNMWQLRWQEYIMVWLLHVDPVHHSPYIVMLACLTHASCPPLDEQQGVTCMFILIFFKVRNYSFIKDPFMLLVIRCVRRPLPYATLMLSVL